MSESGRPDAADERVLKLRQDALDWLPVDDEVVALDNERELYLGANPSGAVLWEALADGATQTELVDRIVDGFDVQRGQAATDVEAFIAQLEAASLLDES